MERFRSQEGIALLLVLWVLTILMVIVLSFSFTASVETRATLGFRDGIEKRFLAEAGIERGVLEIFYRTMNKDLPVLTEGSEVWKIDGTPYQDSLGAGSYTVKIVDDSGKLNLNALNDANAIILRNLLKNIGLGDEDIDIIVDSILDWKDADDLHHINGVESDYYRSLPNPYQAKNANFDTVEELLLVKGITQELLYGNEERKGIIEYVSVSPDTTGQINANAAPEEVLTAIPGLTPELAAQITEARKERELKGPADVGLPQNVPYLKYTGGPSYTIDSLGFKDDEETGYAVRATVYLEANNKFRYLYYRSPAKIAP